MDFCLEQTSKSNWEDFAEKVTVPIQCSKGAFSLINIIFRKICGLGLGVEPMDFAVSSLREVFSDDGNHQADVWRSE